MSDPRPARTLHLGVDLTDAGAHPAAWRTVGTQAQRLFDGKRLVELVATAQRGLLDLVTLDDAFTLRPSRDGSVRGRLDAALVASRLAPRSAGIGLVPTVTTTHTEPFHVSTAIATIDHVSFWTRRLAGRVVHHAGGGRGVRARRRAGRARRRRGGGRGRRGRHAAVGLVGGRRGDPRRRDRPAR